MKALFYENSLPRQAITALLSRLTPSPFVRPLSPMQMREIEVPVLADRLYKLDI